MQNWILDHLQLVIAGAGAIAWWLNQRRQATAQEETESPVRPAEAEMELEERTRRIREQIQRKIEARARGDAPIPSVPTAVEPPLLPPRSAGAPPPVIRGHEPAANRETERQAEILEQQAALAERLRQAAEMKAAALRRVQFEESVAAPRSRGGAVPRKMLAEELRDPVSLRRAFLLREIIGPPVSLR